MECVITVSYSLLINRGLTPAFKAKKGLRQGDPMADATSIHLLFQAFQHFFDVSGLHANMEKNSLYIAGVTDLFKAQILEELHLTTGDLPFKYLGVPLSSRKLTINQCLPLVERIITRVKCWSTKFLSYSGRLQLTGSDCSKKALVAWDMIWRPKSAGGLNVLDLLTWNKAAISKLLWALAMKKDKLWDQLRNSRPRAGILGFVFAAAVYHTWIERNNRRFQKCAKPSRQLLREIAVQIHIAG
ncbi:uncharacterized protein LOC132630782 [Lycium barbarum]|uniref:uncharacterized protein LOC132630782 n=1 Tax=Lycium barbarum TaxID=112863 RepID=UPI00293F1B0D|nr:uncharacterized protein LOC132630782 [Lycium barbarum]